MKSRRWICACATAIVLSISGPAIARGQGKGHGHGHDKDKHAEKGNRGDRGNRFYRDRDRDELHGWYRAHYNHLPPGLAKRDRLPPGLERQLVVRGTLPPGLRKKIHPCPPDIVRFLPPPPPHCEHVLIGGQLVLVNRSNWLIVDVFHFGL
jgi:Ni/Co efflux regulator RcnB